MYLYSYKHSKNHYAAEPDDSLLNLYIRLESQLASYVCPEHNRVHGKSIGHDASKTGKNFKRHSYSNKTVKLCKIHTLATQVSEILKNVQ